MEATNAHPPSDVEELTANRAPSWPQWPSQKISEKPCPDRLTSWRDGASMTCALFLSWVTHGYQPTDSSPSRRLDGALVAPKNTPSAPGGAAPRALCGM
jgi:hypothetical protein